MIHKKISIIFPYLPKYDVDFILELKNNNPNIQIDIYSDMSPNDLYREDKNLSNLNIFDTRIYRLGPFWFMPGLFKLLMSEKNKNVFIFNANPRDLTQLFLIIISRFIGFKVIAWGMFHRIGGPKWYSSLYYKIITIIAHRVFVYGEIGKLNLIRLGANELKIYKIGNAIKSPKKNLSEEQISLNRKALFSKFPYLKDKFLLLQVVRLTAIKKPLMLIDLIMELKKDLKDFHILIIGGGELEPLLIELVKKSSLQQFITFLGPIYDENTLASWFDISNIFVIPTCIGLSAHQAMYHELPVVTDDSKINQASESEILIDKFNCLKYQEDNIKDFALKIKILKENHKLLETLKQNISSNVDSFSMKRKVENFINGISNIM